MRLHSTFDVIFSPAFFLGVPLSGRVGIFNEPFRENARSGFDVWSANVDLVASATPFFFVRVSSEWKFEMEGKKAFEGILELEGFFSRDLYAQ